MMNKTIIKQLKEKYDKLPKQLKVSLWFTISSIITNGISYLTLPIFTRLLTTEEYGIISIYNSWNSIARVFITLNLSSGVFLTAYVKFNEERETIIASFQGLITAIAFSLFTIYLLFRDAINLLLQLNTLLVIILFVECVLTAAYNMWAMKLKYEYKYRLLVGLSIIMAIANPCLGILLIFCFNNGAEAKIVSGAILQVLFFGWIYVKGFTIGKRFYSSYFWKYALSFGVPLIPHYLSLVILNQSDRLMIASICGESKAGIYSIGYNISCIINLILSGINTSFGPWIMQKINNKSYLEIQRRTNEILTLVSVMCLLVIAVGPELIKIATTKDYYDAMWIIPPVTIGLFFSYLNNTFARVEFYYEKKYYIAFFSLISAVANIVLNYIFIPRFGFIAAGYTTLVSYILLSVLHYSSYKIIARQYMSENKIYDGNYILGLSIAAILICFVMTFIADFWYIRYGIIMITIMCLYIKRRDIIKIFSKGKEI